MKVMTNDDNGSGDNDDDHQWFIITEIPWIIFNILRLSERVIKFNGLSGDI